eukprot:TRINITY_DN34374_c0_g1_i1.p1 TRINITY_DN34374_c0_g1~~TRINITY_DN34374_c0_g1_i1.p1  ORF type:complete len:577 (-),score=69.43 TRINITY_DN34374_c0_g1_i1:321-1982(-)
MAVRALLLSRHRIRTLTHHLLHHLNPHISRISQNPISTSPPGITLSPQLNLSSTIASEPPNPIAEDVNEICRVLSDFRSPHHDIESALHPFSSKISTNSVEQVLKRCRNLAVSSHRFFLWAAKLPGFFHSRESYHILVDILGSCREFPLIWDFLSEMRDGGVEIRPEIFWVIFRSYCRAKLPLDAVGAFWKMGGFGLQARVDDLDHLLSVLCRNGLVGQAEEFFEEVKSEFETGAKSYSILMKGWGDRGNGEDALRVFDKMLERGCAVDVVAYNTLLASLCRGGKIDEAYKRFQEMRSRGLQPNARTYAAFVHAYCEANDMHSTLRILDRMRRHDLAPDVFTYNCIIKLLCKNEAMDEAHQLLGEMFERGATPDVWSYNAILAAHCGRCEVNRALGLLKRMKRDSCRPDRHTYNMLLKMLIEAGRVDRAMEIWDGMEEMGFFPSVTTYAVMIHGLAKKKGRIEDACRYFEMMVDEGIPPYTCTCSLLRDRLLGLGLRDRTHILADKMRGSTSCSIQELSDTMSSSYSSTRAAELQIEKGRKDYSETIEADLTY